MPSPFLSSEEYDERAHQLYNEGNYDDALDTLREGLALYPSATELHVGVGYARVAREEYLWARRSFEEALVLDPDHEDALAGLGETLLKFGQTAGATKSFHRILELGYQDDVELMLQVGRALFREGLLDESKEYFDIAVRQVPDNAEAVAMVGYTEHRLGRDDAALATLRRALQLDPGFAEARIYLGEEEKKWKQVSKVKQFSSRVAPKASAWPAPKPLPPKAPICTSPRAMRQSWQRQRQRF